MKFIQRDFQFQGMRKPQSFVIYTCKSSDVTILLQSDNRMMRVSLDTGKALLSENKSSGAYGHDLSESRGAKVIELTLEQLEQVKEMRDKMAPQTRADNSVILIGS